MLAPEIEGHDRAQRLLANAVRSGRPSHAYLFTGPAGIGKRSLAVAFAMGLNCLAQDVNSRPCRECSSCERIAAGTHPDFHMIRPDGATVKIDQIRDIRDQAVYPPFEGKWQVWIIDGADRMTEQAANGLLKTLEEPIANTIFILIAENMASLLPTVVSRSQVVRFQRLPDETVAGIISAKCGLKGDEAAVVAALSSGSVREALSLAESGDVSSVRDYAVQIARSVYGCQAHEALRFAGLLEGSRDQLGRILDYMLMWYRDVLVFQQTGEVDRLINRDKLTTVQEDSERWQDSRLLNAIDMIEDAKQLLARNVNLRLLLDVLMLRLAE